MNRRRIALSVALAAAVLAGPAASADAATWHMPAKYCYTFPSGAKVCQYIYPRTVVRHTRAEFRARHGL